MHKGISLAFFLSSFFSFFFYGQRELAWSSRTMPLWPHMKVDKNNNTKKKIYIYKTKKTKNNHPQINTNGKKNKTKQNNIKINKLIH